MTKNKKDKMLLNETDVQELMDYYSKNKKTRFVSNTIGFIFALMILLSILGVVLGVFLTIGVWLKWALLALFF